MNLEQARLIPLSTILEKLNSTPTKETTKSAWYLSPFREEFFASFHVIKQANRWYDHGEGIGGDSIDLVRHHLKKSGVNDTYTDAFRWIECVIGNAPMMRFVPQSATVISETDKTLIIKSIKPISHLALIRYIENRGIALEAAKKHLKEIYLLNNNTNKHFYTLGLQNEENGYELRNQYFKGCVRKKHITFIRGTKPTPDGIHIFEGMFDYLTFLTIKKSHENDVMILNSVTNLQLGTAYIKGYGYSKAYTWLHNDKAGDKTTALLAEFLKTEENLTHKPMNAVYFPHKDLNAWHMRNLNLTT